MIRQRVCQAIVDGKIAVFGFIPNRRYCTILHYLTRWFTRRSAPRIEDLICEGLDLEIQADQAAE